MKQHNNKYRGLKRRRDRELKDKNRDESDIRKMKELFESNIIFWGWEDIKMKKEISSVFIQLKFINPVEPNKFMKDFIDRIGDLVL